MTKLLIRTFGFWLFGLASVAGLHMPGTWSATAPATLELSAQTAGSSTEEPTLTRPQALFQLHIASRADGARAKLARLDARRLYAQERQRSAR